LATKKEQREQARADRQAREAEEQKKAQRKKRMLQLGGVLAAAIVIVVIAVVVSSGGSSKRGSSKGDAIGANQAAQLLNGIPQNGITLGNPKAPVTVQEFADLQCPFCRNYTIQQFPSIVAKYVKTGKVKMVFENYAFIGPDSLTAARAAEAAAKQNKLWHFIDVFYNNQGTENTSYVNDAFLTKIAKGAGVDPQKMLADTKDPKIDQAIALAQQNAQQAGVNSTPTFLLKKGAGPAQKLSADQITAALAKAAP
jgi:protein-disulfide isomerase